jgi:uncharacterized protein (TIGR02246 family)
VNHPLLLEEINPMSNILTNSVAALLLGAAVPLTSISAPSTDANVAIRGQLQRYEQALNASDIDSVMTLYTADGVFMPQHSLPAVGREALRVAYDHVFATIKLNIRLEIDEIQPLTQDWAFVRTRSTGQVNVLASDQPAAPEANQELGQ